MTARTVICHYHIFKTAGTSFEAILRQNYGDQHVSFDGPTSASSIDQATLLNVIHSNPDAHSFSSHQISLPVPVTSMLNILPVVFVRHPLLRIRSAYLHVMRHQTSCPATDVMAGFDAWFNELAEGHADQLQICNLQTNLLCRQPDQAPKGRNDQGRPLYDLKNAIKNLEAVKLLGRVEHFDEDVARFAPVIEREGLPFRLQNPVTENIGAPDFEEASEEQLDNFRKRIRPDTWDRLVWFNEQDIELFESVCRRLDE